MQASKHHICPLCVCMYTASYMTHTHVRSYYVQFWSFSIHLEMILNTNSFIYDLLYWCNTLWERYVSYFNIPYLPRTLQPMSSNRSGNHPAHNYHNSSSVGDSRSFEPSPARPKTLNPANTTEAQEDTTTNATNNPEQVDYTNSQSERQSHDSERQSHDSSPSVDHGSMFDITLKSPEPTDIPVNQQFEVSMQH